MITAIRDFLVAPLALVLRVFAVAIALSAVAALSGRPVRFPATVAECVAWQGVWVLGLAVQVVLMLVLHRPHIETSVLMFLPQESFTARSGPPCSRSTALRSSAGSAWPGERVVVARRTCWLRSSFVSS